MSDKAGFAKTCSAVGITANKPGIAYHEFFACEGANGKGHYHW